jgi:hypothetical protein
MSASWHTQWAQRLIRDGLIPKQPHWLTPTRACALLAAHINTDTPAIQKMTSAAYKALLTPAARTSVSSTVYGDA